MEIKKQNNYTVGFKCKSGRQYTFNLIADNEAEAIKALFGDFKEMTAAMETRKPAA